MHKFFVPLLAALLLSSCSYSRVVAEVYGPKLDKHDVLECGFSNGDKFVLSSKYQVSVFRRDTETYRSTGDSSVYSAVFFSAKKQESSPAAPNKVIVYSHTNGGLIYSCSDLGMVNHVPVGNRSYLKANGTWFDKSLIPEKLKLSTWDEPFKIRDFLHEMELTKSRNALVLPVENRLVFEAAITRKGIVKMVYQSTSNDDGLTWSDPVVTKDAKIYELGRSIRGQSFSPQPISFNGKKVNLGASLDTENNN